jgi:hypothetical protein
MSAPHSNPEELVTVAKFMEPVEAQMAKGILESAGIESFLLGENANSLLAFAFRVRLQVRRDEEEAARQVLGEGAIKADLETGDE